VELREGNIIGCNEQAFENKSYVIKGLHDDHVRAIAVDSTNGDEISSPDDQIKPVPITFHRVKLMGFVKEQNEVWQLNDCRIKQHGNIFDVMGALWHIFRLYTSTSKLLLQML
jgi:hypothetical protein